MSKDVDRHQVFQTTRVRTALKNDFSWIQKSQQKKEEQDKPGTDHVVKTRPVPVRQNSHVMSTAKKFESVDSQVSPPLQMTQFIPSEGDSANQANGEVIPPQKDAQPEGSTVETTDDIKPQAPTEELIQNGEAQPEKSVPNTPAENKEEYADTAVYRSNLKHNEGAAEVSADGHAEERIHNVQAQPVSSTKENPEAMSPVEPAEQPVANTTAENKREYADTTAHQSNVEHNEANVSADAHVEDPVAETSAAAHKSKDTAEVPAALAVELKPQEDPSTKTESAGVESTVRPAEGSHPEQAAEEIVEAVAEVVVESLPDKSDAINATPGEEAALRVEPVPDLVADNVSESPTHPGAKTATEGSCEKGPPEQAAGETVVAVAEVAVESSPETPAVTDTAGEEAALQDHVETVKSVEGKVESAASAEPVLKTRAEEVVECEVQPLFAVVEQSVETTPETDRVVELNIEDAVEPVTAKDAEAKVACRAIEMTDALDVEPPTAEAAPELLKDPKQSHTEETRLSQQSDDTNTSEMFQKPVEELRSTQTLIGTRDSTAVCSFCDKIIDGNIKITFSEPLVKCHPDCLKCGVCAKPLGDMRTRMFLRNQVIQCDGCFAKALKT